MQRGFFLDNEEVMVKPHLLINNSLLLIQAAIAGLGIIWTHKNMVQSYLNDQSLVTLLDTYTETSINVYAYYAQQKYYDPKLKRS